MLCTSAKKVKLDFPESKIHWEFSFEAEEHGYLLISMLHGMYNPPYATKAGLIIDIPVFGSFLVCEIG